MSKDELLKVTAALREGRFNIILQDYSDQKKNKKLIYNGCTEIINNEIPTIYLVEK